MLSTLLSWASGLEAQGSIQTIQGSQEERREAFQAFQGRMPPGTVILSSNLRGQEDFVQELTHQIGGLPIPPLVTRPWQLLWDLVRGDALVVEEPLRQLVEEPTSLAFQVFGALWEVRYANLESASPKPTLPRLDAFVRWLEGAPEGEILGAQRTLSRPDRLEALLFLLSLGVQNSLFERVIFVFDFPPEALWLGEIRSDLQMFLEIAQRWLPMSLSPFGIVVGLEGADVLRLTRLHPKFVSILQCS